MSAGNLHVEVQGRDIIVTLPGTNFVVAYFKPAGTSHLIARPNWTNDPDASIELGEFLEQALTAAWREFRRGSSAQVLATCIGLVSLLRNRSRSQRLLVVRS
jgi:hypothetical protein